MDKSGEIYIQSYLNTNETFSISDLYNWLRLVFV
jgi:hypothetical protein